MIDPQLLRQCVHCGLCLEACPTYLVLGSETDSPRGRIHLAAAVEDGTLEMTPEVVRHLDLCLGCRACESACPSGVRYGRILEGARTQIETAGVRGLIDRLRRRLVLETFPHIGRLRLLSAVVRGFQAVGLWQLVEAAVPAARLMPLLRRHPELRSTTALGGERARVAMLRGCVSEVMQGQVNAAAVRVLSRSGVSIDVPAGQGCCGALHLHAGDVEGARRLARANIDAFEPLPETVVVSAAGCGAAMREYGELLAEDPAYKTRAEQLAARVRDLTEVLDEVLPGNASLNGDSLRVTYHDACHLAHAQGVREAPRRLLESLPGVTFVELAESDLCCGSAGSYNLTESEMARELGRRKGDKIEQAAVDCVAVANPGCALQIAAELRRRGNPVRVAHPVELIDEAMG